MRCRVTKVTFQKEREEQLAAGSGQMAANEGPGERLAAAWKAKATVCSDQDLSQLAVHQKACVQAVGSSRARSASQKSDNASRKHCIARFFSASSRLPASFSFQALCQLPAAGCQMSFTALRHAPCAMRAPA